MDENADPSQYLRLLLTRLLETQRCLRPCMKYPAYALLREQFLTNEYTLSEVKSWLEGVESSSPLGPSLSSAPSADSSGHGLPQSNTLDGPPANPFVQHMRRQEPPAGRPQGPSSQSSGSTPPGSGAVINGRITFQRL